MNCPSHNEIRDGLKGKLQATEIEQLYEHLEDCSACRSLVDDAEGDADDLLSALRDESGKVASDESYRRMVRSAEQVGTARLRASLSQSKSSAPQRIRDYDLLESIGKGGMGTLYRAVHSRLKRQVAVKMISERLMNNSDAVTRFMREMEAVGKLEHENIVRALDAGDQDGLLYLVMELVEGLDTGQILNRTNGIAVADACEIARQAAEGLHYAHRKGLIHRDVKPSNLMITGDGCVKVLDMGLALLTSDVDDKSASHGAVGSVDYVSPEQVKNSQTVDGKADIYSLGCTLFHLLAGTPPHRANKKLTVAQRLQAHVTEKVDPVNLWRTEVPTPLAELVSSMLAKSPDDRPRDAAAVASALVPYTKGADLVALVRTARKKSSGEEETPSSQISTATPSRAKPLNADDSSTQQDQLTIEFQREMLRDFGHLARERTQAAQDIQHRFAAHMSELEGGYDTERNRIVSKFESQIQPLQTEYRTRRESATSKYESDSYELVQLEEEFIDEASMHHTVEMEDAKQEIEVTKQNVLDNFKAAQPVPQQKLEKFGHQQAERAKQIDEFKKKTRSILQRRGCLSNIEPATAESTTTTGDIATCLKRFASEVALATLRLQEVYNRPAARYLEEGWGWLLMIFAFIAAIVPCGIVFEWTNWLLWLPASLGIGIVVGVSVRQIVRPIGRRQTLEVFPPLQQAIAEAEAALDGALTAAQAEANRQERNLVASRDQQLTAIDQNWAKTRETMVADYTQRKQKQLLEFQATRKSFDESHERQIAEFEQTYPPKIESLQRQFAEGTEQLDQQVSQRRQEIKVGFDREWHQLATRWSEGAAKFETAVDEMNRVCDEFCPPWSTIDADTWTPPLNSFQATSAIRFGHYDYVVNSIERATDNVTFQQTRASFALPGVLSFPARPSLLLQSEDDGRDVAAATLQNVMLRMLTAFPPAKVRFTIIDPTGLGQNFSMFMHLTDFDERLVSSRIWTEANHINQRLTDLTEHMENVIQKYLRNEFASIQEYNEHAGEVAEPFQVLVVANFPANFSDEAARRLVSIANSGARCGVYTLISTDRKLKMPRNFDLADLETHAATLNWRDRRFWWQDPELSELPLQLEKPPGDDQVTSIIRAVGRKAKDASRVEVPFDTVKPEDDQWWKGDSRAALEVPLGRAGATQLQYLRLGTGTSQHVLISGKTGSGKSTLLNALITNLAIHYSPDEVEFFLIDFKKGVEFKPYATFGLPHARVIAIESEREFGMSVLERLDQELRSRGDSFRQAGVQDVKAYRDANPDARMPRQLLIIDEFQEFFVNDDRISQDAALLLDRLVRQGRAFGIHVILGSQTLAGAYSLARSTLGQMAVRIALQCSETDAHLILSEDNTAARLLSRPGEAIYNDANGMFEGNHPFQVVFLPDHQREHLLKRIAKRAIETRMHVPPSIVFEGNVAADPSENAQLQAMLAEPGRRELATVHRAWLGAAVSIKDPAAADFQRQGGSNLLIVGQHDEAAMGVMAASLVSLAVQQTAAGETINVLDGARPDSPEAGFWTRFADSLSVNIQVDLPRSASDTISKIANEVDRRVAESEESAPAKFLVVYNLARFRDLRRADDFAFGSFDDDGPNLAKQFATILREGPAVGIHCLIWSDTFNTVTRWVDRQTLQDLSLRVLFQMSPSDSSNLMDSPAASRLGVHRAFFHNEEQGTSEKFRPYGLPSDAWLAQIRQQLQNG